MQKSFRELWLNFCRFILPSLPEGDVSYEPVWLGLHRFLEEVTPSHSIVSKRHSIWKLVEKHLDEPIQACTKRYLNTTTGANAWAPELADEQESSGSSVDSHRLNCKTYIDLSNFRFSDTRKPVQTVCKKSINPLFNNLHSSISLTNSTQHHMGEWRKLLASLATTLRDGDCTHSSDKHNFVEVLELCVVLLSALNLMTPARCRTSDGGFQTWESMQHRSDSFCELCYRRTMRAIACLVPLPSMDGWSQEQRYRKISRLSNRFCWYHNPSHVRSRDSTDAGMRDEYFQYEKHRIYRKAFPDGIINYTGLRDHLWCLPGVDCTHDEQVTRRAIYDLLHYSGMWKVLPGGEVQPTLRASVFEMATCVNMSQTDIARELRVSRQAVSRHCKAMDEYLRFRQSRKTVPVEDEAFPPEDDVMLRRCVAVTRRRGNASVSSETKTEHIA